MNGIKLAASVVFSVIIISCNSTGNEHPLELEPDADTEKTICIKEELKVVSYTLREIMEACSIDKRSEVLAQIKGDKIGNCDKDTLDFDRKLSDIMADCGASEIPVLPIVISSSSGTARSSSSFGSSQNHSGKTVTETYRIEYVTGSSFDIVRENRLCGNNGNLVTNTWAESVDYEISNGALTLDWGYNDDLPINFGGTSSQLAGTWTRSVNKSTACRKRNIYVDYTYWCDTGYDITKAVFTPNAVTFTRDFCWTDDAYGYNFGNGWVVKVIDCESYEVSRGTSKVTIRGNEYPYNLTVTYGGKTCSDSEPSVSKMQNACRDAYTIVQTQGYSYDYIDEYYDILLHSDFDDCLDELLPAGFWGYQSARSYSRVKNAAP